MNAQNQDHDHDDEDGDGGFDMDVDAGDEEEDRLPVLSGDMLRGWQKAILEVCTPPFLDTPHKQTTDHTKTLAPLPPRPP